MSIVLVNKETSMELVLEKVFRGLHHCPKIHKHNNCWEINVRSGLATFDHDLLTRLVVASHDHCIRAEIGSSGPGMVKIRLHARKREGRMWERHPTMEEAITDARSL